MKLEFDGQADAAYLRLNDSPIIESEEVAPGIVYDFDDRENVVGIEIMRVSQKTPDRIKELNFPLNSEYSSQLKAVFGLLSAIA
ncbi:MAG: DUF2283 domain-containing protein [Hormoscilla sp. SP5CHS1]|nr:DUF2283 domain-containing protein [Hormoscilla sp. SP12CHS1]MBC6454180.1 DUF2283 domain-containing protein [Hormoscilla sp. SP5CHS1]